MPILRLTNVRGRPDTISADGPWSPLAILGMGAWFGLLSGVAELAAFLTIRAASGEVWPYFGKSRQYPWAIPLVDALLLTICAAPLAAIAAVRPGLIAGFVPRVLITLAMLPPAFAAGTGIHPIALLLLALGASTAIAPVVRRHRGRLRSTAVLSLGPLLIGLAALAVWRNVRVQDGPSKPVPVGAPNVLLVVLDTVRADAVGLGIDDRSKTPNLAALASRGVAFRGARSTAPWTLPSHATLMTGLWPRQVVSGRYGAMDDEVPTLAEVLSERGFGTVGMVANTYYCSYYTGIDRGFGHFEDIPTTPGTLLASAEFGGRLLGLAGTFWAALHPEGPPPAFRENRKDADLINRRFLDWIDHRDRRRPFFAFLNYFDAHDPYLTPEGAEVSGVALPQSPVDRAFFQDWWLKPDKNALSAAQIDRLRGGYTSCIAYLDDRLGRLFRQLELRGLLDDTIVVVTSDHGEAFGEHGLFGHGCSLFDDQIRVPLLIVAPDRIPEGLTIDVPVSVRDLPATILDLVGLEPSILPGNSLKPLWASEVDPTSPAISPVFSEVAEPEAFPPNQGRSPVFRGPMTSLVVGPALVYIRSLRSVEAPLEELYDLVIDPSQRNNLAADGADPRLLDARERLDALLSGSTATGPLTRDRSPNSAEGFAEASLGTVE